MAGLRNHWRHLNARRSQFLKDLILGQVLLDLHVIPVHVDRTKAAPFPGRFESQPGSSLSRTLTQRHAHGHILARSHRQADLGEARLGDPLTQHVECQLGGAGKNR